MGFMVSGLPVEKSLLLAAGLAPDFPAPALIGGLFTLADGAGVVGARLRPVGDGMFVRLHYGHRPTAVYNSVCQQPASVLVAITGGTITGIRVYATKRIPAG